MEIMTTGRKGAFAELKAKLRAVEKGWIYSKTMEGFSYDLVVDDGVKLYKAQVKYASGKLSNADGSIYVNLTRNNGDDRNKLVRRCKTKCYEHGEVDILLVYIPQIDKICWFTEDYFVGKRAMTIRIAPAKNNQNKGVILASDHIW